MITKIKSVIFILTSLLSAPSVSQSFCLSTLPVTASEAEFVKVDGGLLLHKRTGLMWMRCAIGQTWTGSECTGEATKFTWQAALSISSGYEFLGSSQWRLPNIKELVSITEKACVRPAIDISAFPNTPPDDFWTSTPSMQDSDSAWAVAFTNSSISTRNKEQSFHIRLVRSSQASERLD